MEKIAVIVSQIGNGKGIEFTVNEDGVLYYKDRIYVPDDNDLRKAILKEAYSGSFAIHPGSTKKYQDLKMSFWWSGMKREISEFVTKCLVFQRVKAELYIKEIVRLNGFLYPLFQTEIRGLLRDFGKNYKRPWALD